MGRFLNFFRRLKWLLTGRYDTYVKTDYSDNYKISIMHTKRFEGKSYIVTGAGGEIGRAIVIQLASEGATVFCCGRSKKNLENMIQEIDESIERQRLIPICVDIKNPDDVKAAVDTIIAQTDKIDGLVNCAGCSAREKARELYLQENEVIHSVIDTNLKGTLWCCKEALAYMVKQKEGKIVNISSTVGIGGKVMHTEYAASKAAIIALTKNLAMEYGKYGINVNCVSPGIVIRGNMGLDTMVHIEQTNYLGRVCYARDISSSVAFLLSDDAVFITGQNLIVAGGRELGLKAD